jgi:hypothetical protein
VSPAPWVSRRTSFAVESTYCIIVSTCILRHPRRLTLAEDPIVQVKSVRAARTRRTIFARERNYCPPKSALPSSSQLYESTDPMETVYEKLIAPLDKPPIVLNASVLPSWMRARTIEIVSEPRMALTGIGMPPIFRTLTNHGEKGRPVTYVRQLNSRIYRVGTHASVTSKCPCLSRAGSDSIHRSCSCNNKPRDGHANCAGIRVGGIVEDTNEWEGIRRVDDLVFDALNDVVT